MKIGRKYNININNSLLFFLIIFIFVLFIQGMKLRIYYIESFLSKIPDSNLKNAIKAEIDRNLYYLFLDKKVITSINGYKYGISDLTGIENFTYLTKLDLSMNRISNINILTSLTSLTDFDLGFNHELSDISALSSLTSLKYLSLSAISINDISVLSNLTALTDLHLSYNNISDISVLSDLTALTYLTLSSNHISDVSPLSDLAALTNLFVHNNSISDISTLSDLTALTYLTLSSNNVSDIRPLVANSGLSGGDYVNLENNPLSSESINELVPVLKARGVQVKY